MKTKTDFIQLETLLCKQVHFFCSCEGSNWKHSKTIETKRETKQEKESNNPNEDHKF